MKLVLKLFAALVLLVILAFVAFYIMASRMSKKAAENQQKLKAEFAVGRPAVNFYIRARELGADMFFLADPGETPEAFAKYPIVSRLSSSEVFEKNFSQLNQTFQQMKGGSADVQFTGTPPFERFGVKIRFENGVVHSVRDTYLD